MWHIKNVVVKSTFVWGFRKELRFIETRFHFNQVFQEPRGRPSGNRMRNELGYGHTRAGNDHPVARRDLVKQS